MLTGYSPIVITALLVFVAIFCAGAGAAIASWYGESERKGTMFGLLVGSIPGVMFFLALAGLIVELAIPALLVAVVLFFASAIVMNKTAETEAFKALDETWGLRPSREEVPAHSPQITKLISEGKYDVLDKTVKALPIPHMTNDGLLYILDSIESCKDHLEAYPEFLANAAAEMTSRGYKVIRLERDVFGVTHHVQKMTPNECADIDISYICEEPPNDDIVLMTKYMSTLQLADQLVSVGGPDIALEEVIHTRTNEIVDLDKLDVLDSLLTYMPIGSVSTPTLVAVLESIHKYKEKLAAYNEFVNDVKIVCSTRGVAVEEKTDEHCHSGHYNFVVETCGK